MQTIYRTPTYLLEGRVVGKPPTVELYATYPQAQRPRAQRILSLTLPADARQRLAELFAPAGKGLKHKPDGSLINSA